MADSSQPSQNKSDAITAKNTLNFLGNCLREQRFILKAQLSKKRKLKAEENDTRMKIENLHQRIQVELDMNPGLFKRSNRD